MVRHLREEPNGPELSLSDSYVALKIAVELKLNKLILYLLFLFRQSS